MYNSLNGFLEDWKLEASLTLKVLDALTDASLTQAVSEAQPRTLGDLAWHVTGSVGFFLGTVGLELNAPKERPSTAAAIADAYRSVSGEAVSAISGQWSDAKLQETLDLFGRKMTYGQLLSMMVRHQIHHRGQMTILMRQAGIASPGIYGPNEEETAAMRAAREQK
ncbi:DinB family protein [Paenibacillus humicola]|uniref:DinB family protein n=1 Tax=Paenibacillus humicola TaxID=3110540 RepID=UPI00237B7109|nr:DinB family protein [Paenibacillus humicola]